MKYMPGSDIFATGAECIVNPVNCHAHKLQQGWQKGLAGAFEKRFPAAQPPFKKACAEGMMKPGGVQLIRMDSRTGERSAKGDFTIAHVATKDHWQPPSRIEWVDEGLGKLAAAVEQRAIRSVAIPQLGAGLGGLDWRDVRKLIDRHFSPLAARGVGVMILGEDPQREQAVDRTAGLRREIDEPQGKTFVAGIGARDTPQGVLFRMTEVAQIMARRGDVLRSGGALGADSAFEAGWDAEGGRKQIFLSWRGMNDREPNGKDVFAFSYSDDVPEAVLARSYYHRSAAHPEGDSVAWGRLGRGGRAHMARNTNQILGPNPGTSALSDVVLCWTKNGQTVGGTGQALRMAQDKGIPVVNLGDAALKGLSAGDIVAYSDSRRAGCSSSDALAQTWSSKKTRSSPQK